MKVDCSDYRKSMELLALRKKLHEGLYSKEEKSEIEERIKTLEKELKID